MKKKINWLLLIFLIIQCTCTYDRIRVVDPEFEPFIEIFRQEAAMRNIDVSEELEQISIAFGDTEHNAGLCINYIDVIKINQELWEYKSFEKKENLIFHELGHCLLGRGHRDAETDCNECLSYMRSNPGLCSVNSYSSKWRKYYIDELFEIDSPSSSWHECQTEYEGFDNAEIVLDTFVQDTAFTSLNYDITDYDGYEIEMRVTGWEEILTRFFLTWNDKIFQFHPSSVTVYEMDVYDQHYPYNSSKIFYYNDNINWIDWTENEMRFVIRSVDGFYTIFLNDKLVHKMDNEESNTLKFRTYRQNRPLNIQVEFSKLFN